VEILYTGYKKKKKIINTIVKPLASSLRSESKIRLKVAVSKISKIKLLEKIKFSQGNGRSTLATSVIDPIVINV